MQGRVRGVISSARAGAAGAGAGARARRLALRFALASAVVAVRREHGRPDGLEGEEERLALGVHRMTGQ